MGFSFSALHNNGLALNRFAFQALSGLFCQMRRILFGSGSSGLRQNLFRAAMLGVFVARELNQVKTSYPP